MTPVLYLTTGVFTGEVLFCLLPTLVLVLLSAASHHPRAQRWLRLTWISAGWSLWVVACWILELPLCGDERNRAGQTGAPGTGGVPRPLQASGRPALTCKPTALSHYLLRHCGSLAPPRLAAWPRGDPHLQTLSSLLWGAQGRGRQGGGVRFARDHLLLRDGGVVALDWAAGVRGVNVLGRDSGEGRRERPSGTKALGCHTSAPPILLLIPQAWGGTTPHLKGLCRVALRQGFYPVVFHPRGTAGCPLATPQMTEFGDPSDLAQALEYVQSRHPSSALAAVSEGSGSGLLLSYLGECGSSSRLMAAVAISPVLRGQMWFETAMPTIYRWGALFRRKQQLGRYASSFDAVLDVDQALRCSTLRDFEEVLFCSTRQSTRPNHPTSVPSSARVKHVAGLAPQPLVAWALGDRAYPAKDWDGYWERNEPLRDADEVAVPVLCICSRDDPLLPPASSMPFSLFQENPYFFLVMTETGGHCGFTLEGRDKVEAGEMSSTGIGDGEAEEQNWSHVVALEYFSVVANFLREEKERDGVQWDGAAGGHGQAGQRSRPGAVPPPRRRRATVMRRSPRSQAHGQACLGREEERQFTWRRSYTR
ncbi:protein ABHD15 [Lampris incognitus]|uniref:protein ABHD15 n=1 Tax=Lampris incognitus TaxID=2546036 RepID=UPI0024B4D39C|nr:protein ABHD15 [Lampris incognitus]